MRFVMKTPLIVTTILVALFHPLGMAGDHPDPPTDPTAERPVTIATDPAKPYYQGSAAIVETSKKTTGDPHKGSIKILYATPDQAVLHTTAWTVDLVDNSKWNRVSPSLKNPNQNAEAVPPVEVDPGEQYVQFWAQAAGHFPPDAIKFTVKAEEQTTIVIDYTPTAGPHDTGSVDVEAVAGGTPAGYGKLATFVGTNYHSTSWSIDGGSWRSVPTAPPHVTVYATNHTIQFKVNVAGHTAPPTKIVNVPSTILKKLTINYTP